MGLEMELGFDKNGKVGHSPNTVLPSPRYCSKTEKRNTIEKISRRDELLRLKEGFTEISFRRYRSSSCKNTPSEVKRGSIYQNSKEVRKMKKMGPIIEGRQKIELCRSSDASFSFRIVDSLCNSDEESSQKRSSMRSTNSSSNRSIASKFCEPCSSDGFIEFCLDSDKREAQTAETARRCKVDEMNFRCDEVVGPLNDGNDPFEQDTFLPLPKSHSVKVEMPRSPSLSESVRSSRGSSRTRFSPIRKVFDPFMKSKSLRSPLGQPNMVKTAGVESTRNEGSCQNSIKRDFSQKPLNSELDSCYTKKEMHRSVVADSPVHLHGNLKLDHKQGVPFFEFSLNCPEEVIVAKTWKADNAFNWVYTFHSVDSRKKSNASNWGSTDSNKESSFVGQMQVSCYLCSELKDSGDFDNSMGTEFVLYDVAHARTQSTAAQKSHKPNDGKPHKDDSCPRLVEGNCEFDSSNKLNSFPLASRDLHPNLEIAAIVIQVPFEKRESLKYKRGNKTHDTRHLNLLNLSMVEENSKSLEKIKVVIPNGNHGMPSHENRGPSSLLDRWRLGGSCDCGGWDMACPLTVFGNSTNKDQPLLNDMQPLELFVLGVKGKTPAFTMMRMEEGQYAVDFHAQLSTLQAFSMCVAILHGTEAQFAAGDEKIVQLPHSDSVKVLIEEEVKVLIEAVTEEEKNNKKSKVTNRIRDIQPSYVINPPFSPIARV